MGTSQPARGRRRTIAAAVAAVMVAAAAAGIVYRVLAPAEVVTPARVSYSAAPGVGPGVRGTLPSAPLIVDGALRVSATTRQVSADQPVTAKMRNTPYWSYRRWPAQVSGVLATTVPGGTVVVSQWSDGEVVALDARTGQVRWRAAGPRPAQGYEGRRTGASTVYAPAGLHVADAGDRGPVLAVTGRSELRGLDPGTGRELWRVGVDSACRADELASTGGQFVAVDTCASPRAVEFRDAGTGAVLRRWRPDAADPALRITAVGCTNGGSGCRAIRTTGAGASSGYLLGARGPVAAPALDPPGSALVDNLAVAPEGGDVVARSVRTGAQRWRRVGPSPMRVLAVEPGRVYLLTESRDLLTVDSKTGRERSRFALSHAQEGLGWEPGFAYAAGGVVAVERLAEPVDPAADDARYYAGPQPVILAVT